jgi:hypothetical protein
MLKECLCCHTYCTQLWAHLGAIVTASCTVSNRESRYPRWCRVFCLFSVKVCPWYKNKKNSKKTEDHAGVRYVHKPELSVPGIQFRVVPVSLRVFSRHKMMMYTLKVGSTIFTNVWRHRGLDFHFISNSRVDILHSVVYYQRWRVQSGRN